MENDKKKTSIRNKIVLIISICVFVFIVFIYLFSSRFLFQKFTSLESDQVIRNLNRIEYSLQSNIEYQDAKIEDWAVWDDAYYFIKNNNKDFIKNNISISTLSSLKINMLMIIDNDKNNIFSIAIDSDNNTLDTKGFVNAIKSNFDIINNNKQPEKVENIIKLPEGDMFISLRPVVKSDGSGPSDGFIIFGTFISQSIIEKISKLVGFPVVFYSYDSFLYTKEMLLAKDYLLKGNKYFVYPLSKDLIQGYSFVYDINNNPVDIAKVELPRDINNQGISITNTLLMIIASFIILLGFFVVALIERFLVKRLIKLDKDVSESSGTGKFIKTIEEGANDEIGSLAISINKMFNKIKIAQEKEKILSQMQKDVNEKLKIRIEEVEKMNKLMVDRELKMIELKKENIKIKGEIGNDGH